MGPGVSPRGQTSPRCPLLARKGRKAQFSALVAWGIWCPGIRPPGSCSREAPSDLPRSCADPLHASFQQQYRQPLGFQALGGHAGGRGARLVSRGECVDSPGRQARVQGQRREPHTDEDLGDCLVALGTAWHFPDEEGDPKESAALACFEVASLRGQEVDCSDSLTCSPVLRRSPRRGSLEVTRCLVSISHGHEHTWQGSASVM